MTVNSFIPIPPIRTTAFYVVIVFEPAQPLSFSPAQNRQIQKFKAMGFEIFDGIGQKAKPKGWAAARRDYNRQKRELNYDSDL